jgi:membrane associated rhomboid family serine protease
MKELVYLFTNCLFMVSYGQIKTNEAPVAEKQHMSVTMAIHQSNFISEKKHQVNSTQQFNHPETSKKRNAIGRGAWIGAVSGAVLGAITGAAVYEPCDCFYLLGPDSMGESAAGSAIFGAFTGTIAGVLIGTVIQLTMKKSK